MKRRERERSGRQQLETTTAHWLVVCACAGEVHRASSASKKHQHLTTGALAVFKCCQRLERGGNQTHTELINELPQEITSLHFILQSVAVSHQSLHFYTHSLFRFHTLNSTYLSLWPQIVQLTIEYASTALHCNTKRPKNAGRESKDSLLSV